MLDSIKNLLFDLDGTLVDSSGTISASLEYALDRMGSGPLSGVSVQSLIGRPLLDIFQREFAMDAKQATEAIELYREHYDGLGREGTSVYADVPEVLAALSLAGYRLYVATVKPTSIAEKVLVDFQLRDHFSGVAGASMGPERRDKASIIAHALERYKLDAGHSLMVGDRRQDIDGARENGLPAIGVTYGFGSREELDSARPAGIVERSSEIATLLLAD